MFFLTCFADLPKNLVVKGQGKKDYYNFELEVDNHTRTMVDVSYDHYPYALTTLIISFIGYYLVSPRLSQKYVAKYSALPTSVKIFWNTL